MDASELGSLIEWVNDHFSWIPGWAVASALVAVAIIVALIVSKVSDGGPTLGGERVPALVGMQHARSVPLAR